MSLEQTRNSLMVLHPYKHHPDSPTWVFDDPRANLVAEPFVGKINDMMDRLLASRGLSTEGRPYAFSLLFSAAPFPGYDLQLDWTGGDTANSHGSGNNYRCAAYELEGWLCPALFAYFTAAPPHIYIKLEPGRNS